MKKTQNNNNIDMTLNKKLMHQIKGGIGSEEDFVIDNNDMMVISYSYWMKIKGKS